MKKDYKEWHSKKSEISEIKKSPFFHEREIWFCYLGENVGFEQDGRGEEFLRPIIVLKKFNNEVLWTVPLTRTKKKGEYYFRFSFSSGNDTSSAILSQVRLVDAKRLKYKIGSMKVSDFEILKNKIRQLLA